jgi:CRISPR-associated protein Csb2
MLAFGIRYLNGFVAARTAPDDLEAEWPPHPGRVFMALAAAHFQTGADPGEREALLWLQSLKKDGEPAAPCIVAPDAMQRGVVSHYVPVNDKAGPSTAMLQSAPLTRERQPRTFARLAHWRYRLSVVARCPAQGSNQAGPRNSLRQGDPHRTLVFAGADVDRP